LKAGRAGEAAIWFERAATGGSADVRRAVMDALIRATAMTATATVAKGATGSVTETAAATVNVTETAPASAGACSALRDLAVRLRTQTAG
jgi:hypothetical protein